MDRRQRAAVVLSTVTLLGLAAELLLAAHWESVVQGVPFALVCTGLLGTALAATGTRGSHLCAGIVSLGGVFGVWEHLEHNWSFAAEIDATATTGELVTAALTGGNPLLAPGAFVVAGALVWLATLR